MFFGMWGKGYETKNQAIASFLLALVEEGMAPTLENLKEIDDWNVPGTDQEIQAVIDMI